MANNLVEAISFMECYAGLVDRLFFYLKDYLAEDVVLQWFGRTIRGNRHVTSFMLCDNMDTFHMFTKIKPRLGIEEELEEDR